MSAGKETKTPAITSVRLKSNPKDRPGILVVINLGRNTHLSEFDLAAFHRWLISNGYRTGYTKFLSGVDNSTSTG